MALRVVILALVLAGCAPSLAPVTPWTTPETERDRAECLQAGRVWIESQTRYGCYAPGEPRT